MENPKLSQSVLFLEECLNNRSKIVNHDEFAKFLKDFQTMCSENSLQPVIRMRPYGELCLCCNKYITGRNLANSVEIESDQFICSIRCLRVFKKLKPKKIRKNIQHFNYSSSNLKDEVCVKRKSKGNCDLF